MASIANDKYGQNLDVCRPKQRRLNKNTQTEILQSSGFYKQLELTFSPYFPCSSETFDMYIFRKRNEKVNDKKRKTIYM